MTEVIDLPLQHRDALDTHTESEPAVFLGIDARSLEDIRVHHTAAENLKPTGTLADVAALAVADVAAYVNLC